MPLPLAVAATAPLALAGTLLALGRFESLPADRLALAALRHLRAPRRRVLAPEGLPAPLDSLPTQRKLAPLDLPVRSILRSGLVEREGGSFALLLRASGTGFALRSEEEQAALVEAFGRFLNALVEPIEIVVRSEPVELAPLLARLHEQAAVLPVAALADAAGALDLALHIEPLAPALAADRLRRQRARLESTRRLERDRGALPDPTVAAAAEDADELASRLARGESRLFRSGLYLSVRADTKEELQERSQRVRALCASLLLHTVPTSFRALDGWLAGLPLGLDRLGLRRAFDTEALAASFPFAAVDPPAEQTGVLYGLSPSGAPVLLDRFARENYNSVLLARSGAGKSYLAKLEALRLLFRGVQLFVLDPEGEYRRLTEAVGGAYLPLGGPDAVALNPLDLAGASGAEPLAERILFLAELCELLLGGLTGEELALLDRGARACYAQAGISADPFTHARPAPLLADLCRSLESEGHLGASMAERLSPYATGSHSALFSRPTSARPDGPLVCFALRGLPERLKPPALLLALD